MSFRELSAAILLLVTVTIGAPADDRPQFLPLFDKARLIAGNEELPPVKVIAPWRDVKQVGKRSFYAEADRVREVGPDGTSVVSEIKAPDGLDLVWLGATDRTVYLAQRRLDPAFPETPVWDVYPEPRILRFDARSFDWLEPHAITPAVARPVAETSTDRMRERVPRKPTKTRHVLGEAVVDDDGIFVLTYEVTSPDNWALERALSYQVTRVVEDKDQPVWSVRHVCRDKKAGCYRAGRLYSNRGFDSLLQPLTLFQIHGGSGLMVCAGEREDILWLGRGTGEEESRLSRVWEFEPGYVPHDYEDYITRFGVPRVYVGAAEGGDKAITDGFTEEDWRAVARYRQRKQRFDREFEAEIVAGPVVFGKEEARSRDQQVAVAVKLTRRSVDDFREHFPETVVLEITPYGVDNYLKLPGPLARSPAPVAASDRTIWACGSDGIACLSPRGYGPFFTLEWYQPGYNRSPWSNSTNHACATADAYFYTSGAAFNPGPDNDSTGYDVRFQAVGIASGDTRDFVVHVPFQRSPRRNHSEFDVRCISATENRLSIILGTRTEQGALEFDVGSIVNKVAPSRNQ